MSETMVLQVQLTLTEEELKTLSRLQLGYKREDPRKSWKLKEYKEASRLAVEQLVSRVLTDRKQRGLL